MKTKVGVMGSAGGELGGEGEALRASAEALGRVVGCLSGTGGVADEAERLLELLPKKNARAVVLFDKDPGRLLERCLAALRDSRGEGD